MPCLVWGRDARRAAPRSDSIGSRRRGTRRVRGVRRTHASDTLTSGEDAMAEKGDIGWRVMAAGAAFAAGFIARRAITFAWKKTTGKEPPTNPESPETRLAEAIGWAVVMGVGMEVARLLATRSAPGRGGQGPEDGEGGEGEGGEGEVGPRSAPKQARSRPEVGHRCGRVS